MKKIICVMLLGLAVVCGVVSYAPKNTQSSASETANAEIYVCCNTEEYF